jgi:ADP-heptose:LPS heptosyltransferase
MHLNSPSRPSQFEALTFERICVLRLDALGDTLLSTPAIRRLTEACPEVTVLAHPAGSPVLSGLARTVEVPTGASSRELAELVRAARPDAVFCFTEKRRAIHAVWLSRCPRRVGFFPGLTQPLKSLFAGAALTHSWSSPNNPKQDAGVHEVERYGRLLEQIGISSSGLGPLYFPGVDPERARQWFLERGLERPIGVQLTPKWLADGWPFEWLRELCERLPGPVVGLYGPAEAEWAHQHFQGLTMTLGPVESLTGYAALLRQCRQLVTIDTGAAHVASAQGVPVVDVFPERNHLHCVGRWRPWQVAHEVVLKPLHSKLHEKALLELILRASSSLWG